MRDAPPMHNTIVAYRRRDAGQPEGIVAAFLTFTDFACSEPGPWQTSQPTPRVTWAEWLK